MNQTYAISYRREIATELCTDILNRLYSGKKVGISLENLMKIKNYLFTSKFDTVEKLDELLDFLMKAREE